jgi:hypothetical protein
MQPRRAHCHRAPSNNKLVNISGGGGAPAHYLLLARLPMQVRAACMMDALFSLNLCNNT